MATHMQHSPLKAAVSALGTRLLTAGDLSLLGQPRRALLVSRGERAPQPDTPWLLATLEATRRLAAQDEVLVTGVGRTAFDAALWTCTQRQGRAIVALEAAPAADGSWRDFLPVRHLLVWPKHGPRHRERSARHQRDLLMGHLADRAYAIHVRTAGHMAEIAALLAHRRCPVEPWIIHGAKIHAGVGGLQQMPALPHPTPPIGASWEYLTHYTREPDGAWPGEPRTEYLRWLCSGVPYTPRDAFAALCRILSEKRIRACGRLMPRSTPMVCFTASQPAQMSPLRQWRRGLHRWAFTPYGVAVRKGKLVERGARQVTYVSRNVLATAAPGTREFMQPDHGDTLDWSTENEWRIAGDVDLTAFDPADVLALVATEEEARRIHDTFGIGAHIIA